MTKGLVYIAFGEQYNNLAAHTVFYSRQFTDLPICVMTNVENKCPKWKGIENISFINFPMEQKENRKVKTSLVSYSPFDLTLYLDCDSIIQNEGMEKLFDYFENSDLLLNIWGKWLPGQKIYQIYTEIMGKVGVHLPITIYYGGFIGFKKNERVEKFFSLWNQYWKVHGRTREMPALACAVKNSDVHIVEFSSKDRVFCARERIDSKAIIQHEYGKKFFELIGLPDFVPQTVDADKNSWEKVLYEQSALGL